MKINIYILTGLMASCSIILGVIENFIPTPVPAIRLGLANVPIIIMLYLAGSKYAFQVSFLKALIVPVLSANIIFKMSLSVPAVFVSFAAMSVNYHYFKNKLSIITISVRCSFSYNHTACSCKHFLCKRAYLYKYCWNIAAFCCYYRHTNGDNCI